MARGKRGLRKKEIGIGVDSAENFWGESRVPLSKGERKKRLEHDSHLAKSILAVIGVAVLAVLFWLESRGY